MRSGGAVLAFLLVLVPAVASAQTASETAAARDLFRQGLAAIEESRWDDAADAFRRSYELVPRASTLVNLATAQVELGQLVEARESYRTFLANPGRAGRLVEDTRLALEELEPRIAHVRLRIEGLEDGEVVRLDGEEISRAAAAARLPMNPGRRTVEVLRGGEVAGRASFTLDEGEEREVPIAVAALVEAPRLPEEPAEEDGSDDVLASPWFWVGVIGGAVLVAGAVTLGVVLSQPAELYVGNFAGGSLTY